MYLQLALPCLDVHIFALLIKSNLIEVRHDPLHQPVYPDIPFSSLLRVANLPHGLDVPLEEDWWVQPLRVVWVSCCCRWCHCADDAVVLIMAGAGLAVPQL